MDLTQLHILYKLSFVALLWTGAMQWSVTGDIIHDVIVGFIPKYTYVAAIIMGVITLVGYIVIACAIVRIIYSMFWS